MDGTFDREALETLGWRGGDGNAAYLDKTLRHRGIELSLDDRVSARDIFQLFLYALAASILTYLPFLVLAVLFGLASGSGEAFVAFYTIGSIASIVVFWFVLLGIKTPEPISEWRVLLDGRTEQADSVYSKIAGTLMVRGIPLRLDRRRIRTGLGRRQVSNRLVLTEGTYTAYISVFTYGSSLYLGWMMWRSRRGAALIWQFATDLVMGILGRGDTELIMLRTEQPRAMREAVHAACREGLVVAIDQTPVPVEYGFPHGLPPIEGDGSGVHGTGPDLPPQTFPTQAFPVQPPAHTPPPPVRPPSFGDPQQP
jgi:hypothetical protein